MNTKWHVMIALTLLMIFLLTPCVIAQLRAGTHAALSNGRPDYPLYEAQILRHIDGDTLAVALHVLPGVSYEASVRVRGVQAPERGGRAACPRERMLGEAVTRFVAQHFPVGSWVYIQNVARDKYAGRILGDVWQWQERTRTWRSLARFLLSREGQWAVPYEDRAQAPWC